MAFGSNQAVGIAFQGKDEVSPVVRGIRNTMEGFKRDAATGFGLGAGISIFNAAKQALGVVTDVMGDAVRAASNFVESQSKVEQVFKTQAGTVKNWASALDSSYGLTEQAALEAAGTFGNFIQALGNTEAEALDMSTRLTELAGDLSSFNNINVEDVLVSLRSGLAGEAEPMRRLGVDVSAARVELELMEMGIEKVNGKYTEAQKVLGRYRAIMEGTTTAQGDAAKTADTLAGVQRSLNAEVGDAMVRIGTALMPVVQSMLELATEAIPALLDAANNLRRVLDPTNAAIEDQNELIRQMAAEYGVDAEAVIQYGYALRQTERDIKEQEAETKLLQAAIDEYRQSIDDGTLSQEEINARVEEYTAILRENQSGITSSTDSLEQHRDAAADVIKAFIQLDPATQELFGSNRKLAAAVDQTTGALEDNVDTTKQAEAAAKEFGDQIKTVADTDLRDLRQTAKETFAELVKAIESTGNPLRALQREERTLLALRAEAARKEQWWNVARIDQRLEEIAVEKKAQRAVREAYEDAENAARKLSKAIGITREEARALLAQTRKDYSIDVNVDDSDVARAIIMVQRLNALLSQPVKTGGGNAPKGAAMGLIVGGGAPAVDPKESAAREKRRQELQRERDGYRNVKAEVDAYNRSLDDTGSSGGRASGGSGKAAKSAKELREEARKLKEEALEKWLDRVEAAAQKVSDAFQAIAKQDFVQLRDSGQEALEELRKSLEEQIDPLGVIRDQVAQLRALREEAAAKERWDIVAAIDLRLQELAVMERQYLMMQKRYTDESKALDILHNKLDIGKKKAAEMLEEYRRAADVGDYVTDTELARIIVQTRSKKRAMGGPVSPGQAYLVGESGPELLVMGSARGNVVPNHAMGGGGNVYLDGYLVGRIMDERLGRQYGTSTRVTNYRRSN